MGILWELSWKSCVSSHMGILWNTHMGIPWESYGNSHVGILWEFSWESYGNSHRKPVGMGWEWELKFHSHGNPAGTPKEGVKRSRCNEHSTKDHGTQMAMPEILPRGVEKKLRQREEKIQKEDMTILRLIDVALETAVLELAASEVAPIARLLRRNGVNIATCWQLKNYGFVWWVTAADLQFQTIKDAVRDINCFGVTIDETTDCGVQKQLIVYLKTQHHASQKFLGLVSMEGSKTVDIVEAVVSILKRYDLDITKLASVSSDGCSTIAVPSMGS